MRDRGRILSAALVMILCIALFFVVRAFAHSHTDVVKVPQKTVIEKVVPGRTRIVSSPGPTTTVRATETIRPRPAPTVTKTATPRPTSTPTPKPVPTPTCRVLHVGGICVSKEARD